MSCSTTSFQPLMAEIPPTPASIAGNSRGATHLSARLLMTLGGAVSRRSPDIPVALGASDAELARMGRDVGAPSIDDARRAAIEAFQIGRWRRSR